MKTEEKDTADPKTVEELRAFTVKHSEAYNKNDATAYATFFTEAPPARATVEVARLPRDAKVEISAIAVHP